MKQIKARRTGKPAPSLLSARDLALASVGAAVIARREGLKTLSTLDTRRRQLGKRIQTEAKAIGERITEAADSLRAQVETAAQPAIQQFESLLSRVGVSSRGKAKSSTGRRTRVAKPAARKSVRKAARRA